MNFKEQMRDVELLIDTKPRTYIKWKNTEEGRDKTDCYERISDGYHTVYVNANNRTSMIGVGEPFGAFLEELYKNSAKQIEID